MTRVAAFLVPPASLLARYAAADGHYTDAFTVDVPGLIDLPTFIEAFYSAWLFRTERVILRVAGYPSTAADVSNIAYGSASEFAAWRVEDRRGTELLLTDKSGPTRSWFHVENVGQNTRLWFGSAVVAKDGQIPNLAKVLMPAHTLYSKMLLKGAARRLN